jgi:hypothetical protein
MAPKSKSRSRTSADRSSTPRTPPPATPAARAYVRTPAIDRALQHARMLDIHARRMHRLVGNWNGEASPDQAATNAELVRDLLKASQLARGILLNTDMLKQAGFAPTAGSSTSIPLSAGERVVIRTKYWDPKLHGRTNNFEVVFSTGSGVRLKPVADPRAPQTVVPRNFVEPADEIEVDDTPPAAIGEDGSGEDEHEDTAAAAGEGDPSDFSDDPRLPNADEPE